MPQGMRFGSSCFFAVFAVAIFFWCSAATVEAEGLPLADMIRETKVALLRVQEKSEARNLPPLASAVLEVNTIQEIGADGSIKFLVVEIGGGVTNQVTSTVKIKLTPPSPGAGTDVAAVQFADALAEGILSSARSLEEAKQGKPPLVASEVLVALKFAVKRSANGGLSLEFPPFKFKGLRGIEWVSLGSEGPRKLCIS